MRHTLSRSNPRVAEISALLERVRMPDYERLRAQAHLERAEAIADLIARAAAAIRAGTRKLVVRPRNRAFERMA